MVHIKKILKKKIKPTTSQNNYLPIPHTITLEVRASICEFGGNITPLAPNTCMVLSLRQKFYKVFSYAQSSLHLIVISALTLQMEAEAQRGGIN